MPQPLAEVFGFPISNISDEAEFHRSNKLCPYTKTKCTKDKAEAPLGVCSIYHSTEIAITCPNRFKQNYLIYEDAAEFFFGSRENYIVLPEVRLKDAQSQSAGNVDAIIATKDSNDKISDFGSLEIQAVYVSGNIRNPFETYMSDRKNNAHMNWNGAHYPRADYLSSGRKRLAPQILTKGGIFKKWGKKQAIALHNEFFNKLPTLATVDKSVADIAWLIYKIEFIENIGTLKLDKIIYTTFKEALETITTSEPGEMSDFEVVCQKRLDNFLKANKKN